MALARLALRNVQQRVSTSSPSLANLHNNLGERRASTIGGVQRQKWSNELLKRFMATAANDEKKKDREVAVTEKRSRLFPRRRGRRGSLWRNNDIPVLAEFFPSGLGNALMQATENINRIFENLNFTPSQLMGWVKEQDDCYKLRYDVPGLGKDDVKITIHDGVLTIKGEHKEEEEEGSDDEHWSARSYGYYNTSLALPDDAKADEIKAELKNGVLNIVIPRTEKPKQDVKELFGRNTSTRPGVVSRRLMAEFREPVCSVKAWCAGEQEQKYPARPRARHPRGQFSVRGIRSFRLEVERRGDPVDGSWQDMLSSPRI
ncbi:26.5 kDa heat shock protein [Citrus sinensis]|uniref:26.5 kDa heat shock protein n=1 Tax=Citrus sinensis TaxID=2711 RepID=A0ACB8JCR6_CITSI|nr:26.5 kDa heat shock protein [Citrus sinensis]